MALRVLLADESSTIKKVIQLSLQDFGVEVKAVPLGVDVIAVAKSFHPDIIFADVLLAKRNGYEVCGDLKNDAELKNIPVVLMWSGFMDIDEPKARAARPDRRLEKPFDAENIRKLVRELVPPTQGNVIASYLTFPELPEIIEDRQGKSKPIKNPAQAPAVIADFDEPEEFQQVPLPKNKKPVKETDFDEAWAHQDLNKFKVELPADDNFSLDIDEGELTRTPIALSDGLDEVELGDIDIPQTSKNRQKPNSLTDRISQKSNTFGTTTQADMPMAASPLYVDTGRAEVILREEVRAIVKDIAWQLLPEICERVVREELQKLLKDAERL